MEDKNLQNNNKDELIQMISDFKAKLAKLSFEKEASILKNTSQIKKTKKEIARILTFLNKNKSRM